MDNATMVSKQVMFAFMGKIEKSLGFLQMTIARPWTHYTNKDGKVVCAIMDNACMGDPDNTARDHYIMDAFKDYKSPKEVRDANREKALEHDNIGFTLIRQFEEIVREIGLKEMTGAEYLNQYFKAFKLMEDKLNPPKKVKKNATKIKKPVKKTPVKAKKPAKKVKAKPKPTKRKTVKKKSTKK